MDTVQWPSPPTPHWSMLFSQEQKISSWTSAYFVFWRRKGEVFVIASALKSFILQLLLKLDLAMSTLLDINLLFKIIEGFSQKGVQASSGLACEWVIPENIHTPTTKGMLENLTGEGVNGSGKLDCTHFSCTMSAYSRPSPRPLRKKSPLGSPVKFTFRRFLFFNKKENLLFEYTVSFELYCSISCCIFCWSRKKEKFTQMWAHL